MDAVYNNEKYVFDATASINDPGRYINHAKRNCNIAIRPPVMIGELPNSQLKIGFVAIPEKNYSSITESEIRIPHGLPLMPRKWQQLWCNCRAPQNPDHGPLPRE